MKGWVYLSSCQWGGPGATDKRSLFVAPEHRRKPRRRLHEAHPPSLGNLAGGDVCPTTRRAQAGPVPPGTGTDPRGQGTDPRAGGQTTRPGTGLCGWGQTYAGWGRRAGDGPVRAGGRTRACGDRPTRAGIGLRLRGTDPHAGRGQTYAAGGQIRVWGHSWPRPAARRVASSGPVAAQHSASLPSMATDGARRTPRLLARSAT